MGIVFCIYNTRTEMHGGSAFVLDTVDKALRYRTIEIDKVRVFADMTGAWDGYYRFLRQPKTKAAWFETGLRWYAFAALDEKNIPYEVRDVREGPSERLYDWPDHRGGVELRNYQEAAVEAAMTHPDGVIVAPPRCFAEGTPMILSNGQVIPVEQIREGMDLLGPDGDLRKVGSTHTGEGELYRLTPRWGNPITVNGDHILPVLRKRAKQKNSVSFKKTEVVEVSVREWLQWPKSWRQSSGLLRVPMHFSEPQSFLPIAPYHLGVLLGDGCFTRKSILLGSSRPEIQETVFEIAKTFGIKAVKYSSGRTDATCPRFCFSAGKTTRSNPLTGALKELGLMGLGSHDKFIPENYLTASLLSRRELLAGLLDTDGYNRDGHSYEWWTVSNQQNRDVLFLVHSLGLYLSTKKVQNNRFNRMTILGDVRDLPLRVPHKQIEGRSAVRLHSETPFTIEPMNRGQFFGFTVDKDHRFLMPDGTVQHNSGKTTIGFEVLRRIGQPTLWIAPTRAIVDQTVVRGKEWFGADQVETLKNSSLETPIVVGTAAGVLRTPADFWESRHCLLTDESHHFVANNAWGKILKQHTQHIYHRKGMTGTFNRSDGDEMSLHALVGRALYTIKSETLMDRGFLVPTKVAFLPIDKPRARGRGFIDGYGKTGIFEHKVRNGWAAKCALELHKQGKRVVVLVGTKKQGYLLQALLDKELPSFNTKLSRVEFMSTDKPKRLLAEILDSFREHGRVEILIGTSMIGEGVDLPSADALVYAKGGHAEVTHLQGAYRVCTPAPDKKYGIIVDFADKHHLKLVKQSRARYRTLCKDPVFEVTFLEQPDDFKVWLLQRI